MNRENDSAAGPLEMSTDECAAAMGGDVLADPEGSVFSGYAIDSRQLKPRELFFAIVGPNHDAHRFVAGAAAAGAAGVVVSRGPDELPGGLPPSTAVIRVPDTTRALGDLAAHARRRLDRLTLVGVTGSCGKTTAKEICADLLSTVGPTLRSAGNLNNLFGLPLTLLRLGPGHRLAVCEMGISTPEEMERLVEIAAPDIGVVLNVNPVHLENFTSVDHIAREKGRLVRGLAGDGTAVLNADDPRVAAMRPPADCRTITFGMEAPADVAAEEIRWLGIEGTAFTLVLDRSGRRVPMRTSLPGRHNLSNLLAALAAARAAGLDPAGLARAVAGLEPFAMRGVLRRLAGGVTIYDDSYNANPRAMAMVMELLGATPCEGRRLAALGDMLELGEGADRAHRVVGRLAAESGFDLLAAVGQNAANVVEGAREGGMPPGALHSFREAAEAGEYLAGILRPADLLLVKGSRGVGMEAVVARIMQHLPAADVSGESGGARE